MEYQLALEPISTAIAVGTLAYGAYNSWREREAQKKQNVKDRKYQNELYAQQRSDAKRQWDETNAYNSPLAQQSRLQAAGLNPNLVYGNGHMANISNPQEPVSVPFISNQPAAKYDQQGYKDALNMFAQNSNLGADLQTKQATIKNIEANTIATNTNRDLTQVKIANEGIEGARNKFELGIAQDLKDNTVESAKLRTQAQRQDMKIQVQDMDLKKIATGNDTKRTLADIALKNIQEKKLQSEITTDQVSREKLHEEIKNLEASRVGIENDGIRIGIENKMREQGINPNDPSYVRILLQALAIAGLDAETLGKSMKETLNPSDASQKKRDNTKREYNNVMEKYYKTIPALDPDYPYNK